MTNIFVLQPGLIDSDEDDYVDAEGKRGKIDHSSAGAQVIYRFFSNKGNDSKFLLQILSLSIASHHSGLIDCLTVSGEDNYSRRMNKSNEKTRIIEVMGNMDDFITQKMNNLISADDFVTRFNQKLTSLQEKNGWYHL